MQVFIQHDGQQTGPFPLEQVRARLADGTYQPTALAWYEGAPGWLPLSTVPGIFPSAPPALPGALAGGVRTCGLAIWSLVLGILAWLLFGLTAIPAVVCGHIALGRIKRSSGSLTGSGLAIAGLVTGYAGAALFLVALIAGLAAPLMLRSRNSANRAMAISNLRQIGLGLSEFESEFGSFPCDATAAAVADSSKTALLTGTSSNAYFRQLIRSGIIPSEMPFYARTPHSRKPDGVTDGNHLLEPGECAFAYVLSAAKDFQGRHPLAMAPFEPGTLRFDPKPFDGKALVLWSDNSVTTETIDRHTGDVIINGRNLLDPANPLWGGKPPLIAMPE